MKSKEQGQTHRLRPALGAAAIIAVTLAVYAPVRHAGFIWDDSYWLTENPVVQAHQAPLGYWSPEAPTADYLPVTSTAFWFMQRLWDDAPLGYHLINVALHALGAVLLWRVLVALGVPGAWLAALVFAVHPLAVGSAAWVAEIKNTLSLVWFLAGLLAYLAFDERRRWRWYAVSLALFVLAGLTKQSVVILPVVMLGAAWWRRRRIAWRDVVQTAPFFALAVLFALVTIWFQHNRAMDENVDTPAGLLERVMLAGRAVWFYLAKAVAPVNLMMIYPRWNVHGVSVWSIAAPVLLVAAIVVLLRRANGWARPAAFGLGYFLVALLPILGLVNTSFMMHSFVADHWAYLALPGVIALVVGAAWSFCGRRSRAVRISAAVAAGIVVVALGVLSFRRAGVFQGPIPLWEDNVRKNWQAYGAHNNLASALAADHQDERAMRHYLVTIEQKPDYAKAYNNLGILLARQDSLDEAVERYRQAIKLDPRYPDAHENLAAALAKQKDFAGAAENFALAIRHRRGYRLADKASLHDGLASALVELGRLEEALIEYGKALAIEPQNEQARKNTSVALTRLADADAEGGRLDSAVARYRRASALDPKSLYIREQLGEALAAAGRADESAAVFAEIESVAPGYAQVRFSEAKAAADAGDAREAVRLYRLALRARGDYAAALNNLAWILATDPDPALRDGKAAVPYAERACRLSEHKNSQMLLCLAAAYAEAHQALKAAAAASQAADLAADEGDENREAAIRQLAGLYAQGKTYRDYARAIQQGHEGQ